MLLRYLAKSKARRELLRLLWAKDAQGSVSELARLARVPFSAAHRELEEMREAGLAWCERVGKRLVYRADTSSPSAAALRGLLEADANQGSPAERAPSQPGDAVVRGWLRDVGAPLVEAQSGPSAPMPSLEEALACGLELAHRDPTVTLVLPVVLWRQRQSVQLERLAQEATRQNERHTLGFFLEMTARLSGDHQLRRFAAVARKQRDPRRHRRRLFFVGHHGRFAREAAKINTPPVALSWGFEMNMPLESFQSAFVKHTAPDRTASA